MRGLSMLANHSTLAGTVASIANRGSLSNPDEEGGCSAISSSPMTCAIASRHRLQLSEIHRRFEQVVETGHRGSAHDMRTGPCGNSDETGVLERRVLLDFACWAGADAQAAATCSHPWVRK